VVWLGKRSLNEGTTTILRGMLMLRTIRMMVMTIRILMIVRMMMTIMMMMMMMMMMSYDNDKFGLGMTRV